MRRVLIWRPDLTPCGTRSVTVSNPSNRWFNDVRADYRVHRDKAVTCSDYNLTMPELKSTSRPFVRPLSPRQSSNLNAQICRLSGVLNWAVKRFEPYRRYQ